MEQLPAQPVGEQSRGGGNLNGRGRGARGRGGRGRGRGRGSNNGVQQSQQANPPQNNSNNNKGSNGSRGRGERRGNPNPGGRGRGGSSGDARTDSAPSSLTLAAFLPAAPTSSTSKPDAPSVSSSNPAPVVSSPASSLNPSSPSFMPRFPHSTTSTTAPVIQVESSPEPLDDSTDDEEAVSAESFRVKLEDLPLTYKISDLHMLCNETLVLNTNRVWIIRNGQKSTGRGWIELNSMEDAIAAEKALNGYAVSETKIKAAVEKKSSVQRRLKRKNRVKKVVKQEPYEAEIVALKKRFGESSAISDTSSRTITVSVPPSDPALFPYDLKFLEVELSIPEDYPYSVMVPRVVNSVLPDSLKKSIANRIIGRANAAYRGKEMLVGLFTWTQNNLDKLMIDDTINREYQIKNRGVEVFAYANDHPPEPEAYIDPFAKKTQSVSSSKKTSVESEKDALKKKTLAAAGELIESSSSSDSDSDADSGSAEEYSDDSDEEADEKSVHAGSEGDKGKSNESMTGMGSAETAHRGTQISCNIFESSNVAIAQCFNLQIESRCNKCKQKSDITVPANVDKQELCPQCQTAHVITFRSALIHENSHIWGYLDLDGVSVFDILPSSFNVTCLDCGEVNQMKNLTVGSHSPAIHCHKCFKPVKLFLDEIVLSKVQVTAKKAKVDEEEAEKRRKANRPPKEVIGIRKGEPLPDNGACKHYRKSFRWMRFPCCNKVFPCDICHDDACDHHAEWAKRMICGYCATEQPFSSTAHCKACGSSLSGHHNTAFWEGGDGVRNRNKMSKKDHHKYAGLHKTVSRKARRGAH